jgi:hypothetical protein
VGNFLSVVRNGKLNPIFHAYSKENAIGFEKSCSRLHRAVIRVCDARGNVIETHDQAAISTSEWVFQGAEILSE